MDGQTLRENHQSRDKGYDFIRFLATLMILIHHFRTTLTESNIACSPAVMAVVARGRMDFGVVGVALFFMLSGALMIRGAMEGFSVTRFYRKRMLRIMIPQWIGFCAAFLVTYIYKPSIADFKPLAFLISFTGLNYAGTFWRNLGMPVPYLIGEWFTAVIIILYVFFPLLRWLFIRHRTVGTVLIAAIFAVNMKLKIMTYGGNGCFSITNGFMYFWMGMLFETYKEHIKRGVLSLCAILCIILVWRNPSHIGGFGYLPVFLISVGLFPLLYQIKFSSQFIAYICKYNYEIYLVHHRVFLILIPMMLSANSRNSQILLAFLAFTGLTFLLAEVLQKLSNETARWLSASPKKV